MQPAPEDETRELAKKLAGELVTSIIEVSASLREHHANTSGRIMSLTLIAIAAEIHIAMLGTPGPDEFARIARELYVANLSVLDPPS